MLNLKEKVDKQLSENIKSIFSCCSEAARDNGYRIYLVGGVVRDLILGMEIFDVDITVEGDAVEFCRHLEKKCNCSIKQIQQDLRTAKVVFDSGIEIDFASTRKESYPKSGHMPVIEETGCALIDDVKRRDFTVNALVMSLNKEDFGAITDYVGGLEDIEKKQLKVLHDKSFIDDPTRIIRGLKFSVRLGFGLEENTLKLQNEYLESHLSEDICWSRVRSELIQTFSMNLPKAYDCFIEKKIYKLINPNFDKNIDSSLVKELADKYKPENIWLVYLGAVLYNSKFSECLGLNKAETKILADIQRLLDKDIPSDKFEIYKLFKGMSLESILVFYFMIKSPKVLVYLDELRHVKIHISGDDLIKLGLQPSEQFGTIFDAIIEEKFNGNLLTKEEELEFAANFLQSEN